VAKAGRVLMLVASLPEETRTAMGIAQSLGLSLPTAYHLLNTLVDSHLLVRDERKRYHLDVGVDTLAHGYDRQAQPPRQLLAPLEEVGKQTGENVYLSGWRLGELQVLAQLEGTRAVRVASQLTGFRGNAHARASGKVLLAYSPQPVRQDYAPDRDLTAWTAATITNPVRLAEELREVRDRGYAVDEEEFTIGVGCVAVPLISGETLIGAYTVSAPVERYRSNWGQYLDVLRSAAALAVDFGKAEAAPESTEADS
jgi:DNA-binding IclR family transcriptional regulator